jgi:hypothetical protein
MRVMHAFHYLLLGLEPGHACDACLSFLAARVGARPCMRSDSNPHERPLAYQCQHTLCRYAADTTPLTQTRHLFGATTTAYGARLSQWIMLC